MATRIAVNGFGRIGRMVTRALFERNKDKELTLVGLNIVPNVQEILHLLRYDSTHGYFAAEMTPASDNIEINGTKIQCFNQPDPSLLPWKEWDVDIVLECSGRFTKRAQASMHLKAGAKKVLISAPSPDSDSMIVCGVNDAALKAEHQVVSGASCTTNCLAPVAKILMELCGVKNGFMTTVHAYTSDQGLLDQQHKDPRRARAAVLSLIPTSTGATHAIDHIIPELAGKLDGAAIRAPVSNVSMIDLVFQPEKAVSANSINQAMEQASCGALKGILAYNDAPLVSIDFNHNPASAIFDATQTQIVGGELVRIVAWYDNEWGYANRMIDLACQMV